MKTKENNDTYYFSILIIIAITITGIISSLGRYSLFSKIEDDSKLYEQKVASSNKYELFINRVYSLSRNDINLSLSLIDSLSNVYPNKLKQWDLNYVKARVYYETNMIDSALKYNAISKSFRQVEKNLLLDIACFIKKEEFAKAESIFKTIDKPSNRTKLLEGNFYEILNEGEKAKKIYQEIMQEFPSSYNYLNYNIEKIERGEMAKSFSLPTDNGRKEWIPRPLFYRKKN